MSNPAPPDSCSAVIRRTPADFAVEEIPAYAATGAGDHLFVTFRKTGLTTPQAVRALAQALGAAPEDAGFAGMKDKWAVTTQTASFPFAAGRDPQEALALSLAGIEVLAAARHPHKLRTGHLRGNRFTVALRDVAADALPAIEARLAAIAARGVPNAFGPQRFGRDGDNPERALAWLAGRERPPRDKRERRLLFSALQSRAFNQVLAIREQEGSWDAVLLGDLAQKTDSGGVFLVGEADLEDARARAAEGRVAPTGPMFGAKMRWPEGRPAEIERAVLAGMIDAPERLAEFARYGEGARRSLRLAVEALTWRREPDALTVSFALPKGGYATTVLARACHLIDRSSEQANEPGLREAARDDRTP